TVLETLRLSAQIGLRVVPYFQSNLNNFSSKNTALNAPSAKPLLIPVIYRLTIAFPMRLQVMLMLANEKSKTICSFVGSAIGRNPGHVSTALIGLKVKTLKFV